MMLQLDDFDQTPQKFGHSGMQGLVSKEEIMQRPEIFGYAPYVADAWGWGPQNLQSD